MLRFVFAANWVKQVIKTSRIETFYSAQKGHHLDDILGPVCLAWNHQDFNSLLFRIVLHVGVKSVPSWIAFCMMKRHMKQLLAFIVRILSQNYVNVVKQFLIHSFTPGGGGGIFWYLYCFGGNWFHVNYLVNCCTAAAFNFCHNLLSLSEFSDN